MEPVIIQLTKGDHYNVKYLNPFNIGGIIKIKGQKRICLTIRDTSTQPYTHTISMVKAYNPSPKSVLKRKSVFSKEKLRIV